LALHARPTALRRLVVVSALVALGLLGGLAARQTAAVEQTATIPVAADTYVRQVAQNANEGGSPFLSVRALIDHHGLVRFDQSAIEAAVGGNILQSAVLRMTIVQNSGYWGPNGQDVAAHRLNVEWAEGNGAQLDIQPPAWTRGTGSGATWNCAVDSNIANIFKNCSGVTEWSVNDAAPAGPWDATATDAVTITTGQSGLVEWNVTADVQAFLDGATTNNGWILRRVDSAGLGDAHFATRESGANAAELVLTFVAAAPEAVDDSYEADINTGLSVAAPGVLGNDLGSGLSAVPQAGASTALGGTVTLNADGSFDYAPPPGADADDVDTFSYTVENAAGSDTGEVTITLTDDAGVGTLWFIDNSDATPPFDGTFAKPFNSLAQFNASAGPEPGDTVFIYAGSGLYDGGIVLQDDQTLLGEGVGLTAGSISIPPGARPTLTNAAGDGVALASGNSVRGLNVGDTSGTGLAGASVGGLSVSDVAVNGAGAAVALAGGDVSVSLDEASASGVDAGISLSGLSGSVSIASGTLSNNVNAVVLDEVENVTLSNLTISGSTGDGVLGTNVTALTIQDSSIDATGDEAEEHGVDVINLLGASAILNTSMSGAAGSNISVNNSSSTGADVLTLSGLTLDEPQAAFGRDNIFIGAATSGSLSVVMDGSAGLNSLSGGQDGIEAIAMLGGVLDVSVTSAAIEASFGVGVNLGALNGGTVTFDVFDNNDVTGGGIDAPDGVGINISNLFGGTMSGTISGNEITGVEFGSGIRVVVEGDGSSVVAVSDNAVFGNANGSGIEAQARAGTGTLDLTITDNVIDSDGLFSFDGVNIEAGSSAGGTNTICLNMSGNSSDVDSGEEGYRMRQRPGATFALQDFTGDGTLAADVTDWVQNVKANAGSTQIIIGTAFSAAPAACQVP
jgi:hypothetical protein